MVRYSRQPKLVLDTIAGTKASRLSVWQATACNFGLASYTMSAEMITYLAASKISVTDLQLTQAVIERGRRNTLGYRLTDHGSRIVNVAGAVIPSLQAAQIIRGSPWISGGVAAASIAMQILVRQKDQLSLSQLPGNWSGSKDLRTRECGVWLFLGEYTPKMSSFEVAMPQAVASLPKIKCNDGIVRCADTGEVIYEGGTLKIMPPRIQQQRYERPEWPEPVRLQKARWE